MRQEGVERALVADLQREFVIAAGFGLRAGGRRRRSRRRTGRRHQRHVFTAERTIHKGFLPIVGGLEHLVAHEAERAAHVEPRLRQMVRQRRRKRAVLAVTVGRGGPGLGRIGDQDVRAGRLDLGQALPDRARSDRALHGPGERIVAAGVENHQAEFLGRLDRDQDAVEREALVIDVGVAFQPRIDRDQVVPAVHLDAVAGVIDHRDIGIARTIGEIAQRATGLGRRQVAAGIDDVEAGVL